MASRMIRSSYGQMSVSIGMRLSGRRLDGAHVLRAHEREIERARDRRGREREHVHELEHLLELLLVQHAEALLLVDDDEAEVLERDVLRDEPVRADDDIDAAVGAGPSSGLALLRVRCESGESISTVTG